MRLTRFVSLALLVALASVLASCGGGASGPSADGGTVLGTVVSRDGSTADLSGVEIVQILDGSRTATDGTGRFQLTVRARERIRLRFEDPAASNALPEEDVEESEDSTPDDADIDGDEVEIKPLEDGESCEIEVEIENGEIVECWVERHHKDGDREGEARLRPPECEESCTARGEIEIDVEDGCVGVEVEVAGLEGPDVLEILLVDADGSELSLGTIDVNEDGSGHFVMEACAEGGDLPFDVDDVDSKAGAKVLLVDAEGIIVLKGFLPGGGPQHDDEDRCHGATKLLPPDGSPETEAKGEAVVKCDDDCCSLLLEAWGFAETGVVDVELVPIEGDAISLGEMEIGAAGMGRFLLEGCLDDVLAEVGDLPDLPTPGTAMVEERPPAAFALQIVDADGTVLLRGDLPTPTDGRCGEDGHHGGKEPPLPPPPPATAYLKAPEGADESEAKGALLVKCHPECDLLVLEVARFTSTHVADVIVEDADGNAFVLGEFEIGKEGMGRFAYEACAAEDFPEGTESLADLAGWTITVEEEGTVLLVGKLPEAACQEGEEKPDEKPPEEPGKDR